MSRPLNREAFLSYVPAVYRHVHEELLDRLEALDWLLVTRASAEHRYSVRLKSPNAVILEVGGREGQSDIPTSRATHDIGTKWSDLPEELQRTYRRLWADYVKNPRSQRGTLLKGSLASIGVNTVIEILEAFHASIPEA